MRLNRGSSGGCQTVSTGSGDFAIPVSAPVRGRRRKIWSLRTFRVVSPREAREHDPKATPISPEELFCIAQRHPTGWPIVDAQTMASVSEPARSRWGTALTDLVDLAGWSSRCPLAVLLVGTPFALISNCCCGWRGWRATRCEAPVACSAPERAIGGLAGAFTMAAHIPHLPAAAAAQMRVGRGARRVVVIRRMAGRARGGNRGRIRGRLDGQLRAQAHLLETRRVIFLRAAPAFRETSKPSGRVGSSAMAAPRWRVNAELW